MNERCVTSRLRIEGVWIKFIQVCALTDYKDDVAKDAFFGCICPNWGKLLKLISLKKGICAAEMALGLFILTYYHAISA